MRLQSSRLGRLAGCSALSNPASLPIMPLRQFSFFGGIKDKITKSVQQTQEAETQVFRLFTSSFSFPPEHFLEHDGFYGAHQET